MPYDDPEPDDPHELIGVELPGDEAATREMAAALADEFAQLGFDRSRILALYREPHYAGAHRAWQLLGEDAIARIIDESLAVYGQFSWAIVDVPDDDEEPASQPLRLYHGR